VKIPVMGVLMVVGMRAWAAGGGAVEKHKVPVCLSASVRPPAIYSARPIISDIFEQVRVQIEWQPDGSDCRKSSGAISISLSDNTPQATIPGALAYSQPFEGTHIVVFFDRVSRMVEPAKVPSLLAHVLVHEITHVLEGCDSHSDRGVMKAHWDARDYVHMSPGHLTFTAEDVVLIDRGLDGWESRYFPSTENASRTLPGMPPAAT